MWPSKQRQTCGPSLDSGGPLSYLKLCFCWLFWSKVQPVCRGMVNVFIYSFIHTKSVCCEYALWHTEGMVLGSNPGNFVLCVSTVLMLSSSALVDWLIDGLVDWLIDWLTHWLIDIQTSLTVIGKPLQSLKDPLIPWRKILSCDGGRKNK